MTGALNIIADEVCSSMGVRLSELFSRSRVERIVRARHVVCYLARQLTDLTQKDIGQWIGRDHASVCIGEQRVKDTMDVENRFANLVYKIRLKAMAKLNEKINA